MSAIPGLEYHTFTIVGRCQRTGLVGICLASNPITVASRCAWVRGNVGAVATQAYAHPGLGPLGLRLLEMDYAPTKVLSELQSTDPWYEYRQVAVLDRRGEVAVHTGSKNQDWKGHVARRNFVAMGNYLTGQQVVEAMARTFEESEVEILEERLLRALEAGKAAGGERGGQNSAGLIVSGGETYPRTDLRVDWYDRPMAPSDDALSELRRVFDRYRALIPYYEGRPANPTLPPWREWAAQQSREDA